MDRQLYKITVEDRAYCYRIWFVLPAVSSLKALSFARLLVNAMDFEIISVEDYKQGGDV